MTPVYEYRRNCVQVKKTLTQISLLCTHVSRKTGLQLTWDSPQNSFFDALYIQCYKYSYVIKLFKLTLSKIFFLLRFTNRFRGMMKLLRICFQLRPCLIHDRHSVCFIMERQKYNVTHAFFFLAFHSKEPSFCLSHFVYYRLLPSWSYWTSNITVILNGRFIEDVFISRQMPV